MKIVFGGGIYSSPEERVVQVTSISVSEDVSIKEPLYSVGQKRESVIA